MRSRIAEQVQSMAHVLHSFLQKRLQHRLSCKFCILASLTLMLELLIEVSHQEKEALDAVSNEKLASLARMSVAPGVRRGCTRSGAWSPLITSPIYVPASANDCDGWQKRELVKTANPAEPM